jgi:hypothetical protein
MNNPLAELILRQKECFDVIFDVKSMRQWTNLGHFFQTVAKLFNVQQLEGPSLGRAFLRLRITKLEEI